MKQTKLDRELLFAGTMLKKLNQMYDRTPFWRSSKLANLEEQIAYTKGVINALRCAKNGWEIDHRQSHKVMDS